MSNADPVLLHLIPKEKDIGDFSVRRALPASECRSVGPFVFFDHFGPVVLQDGQAMDVRPHPHIGLSTITWLFEGEVRHQDSLGSDVVIRPGAVNWMTAGRGIVHSERSPQSARQGRAPLYGIQTWLALPREKEEMDPAFFHFEASRIPRLEEPGLRLALIAGSGFGLESPVPVESPTFYAELRMQAGHSLAFPVSIGERGIYIVEGSIRIGDQVFEAGSMVVLRVGVETRFEARVDCLCILVGGAPLDGPRLVYWNFVSSRPERIEQAKEDWKQGRFPGVEGDPEFIPLPD